MFECNEKAVRPVIIKGVTSGKKRLRYFAPLAHPSKGDKLKIGLIIKGLPSGLTA